MMSDHKHQLTIANNEAWHRERGIGGAISIPCNCGGKQETCPICGGSGGFTATVHAFAVRLATDDLYRLFQMLFPGAFIDARGRIDGRKFRAAMRRWEGPKSLARAAHDAGILSHLHPAMACALFDALDGMAGEAARREEPIEWYPDDE